MDWRSKPKVADRYKVAVDKVVRDCVSGATTLRAVARVQHPTITILAYLRVEDIGQRELARRLGTSQATVSRLLDGSLVPDSQLRLLLQTVCWIPAELWDKPWKAA